MRNKALLVVFVAFICIASVVRADSQPVLRIGGAFSLSGYGAIAGTAEMNGAILAIEELNRQGGVNGRQLEFLIEDTKSDLKGTADAVQKLAEVDKVPAIVGPNWAEFAEVAAGLSQRSKVVQISPTGYTPTLTKDRPFVFSALESHAAIVHSLGQYILKQKHKKLAALVVSNAYYESLFLALKEQLESSGAPIQETYNFNPADTDYRSVISRMKVNGVDGVIALLLEGGSMFAFLKQARELSLPAAIYSGNSIPFDDSILKNLKVAEGIVYFNFIDPSTAAFKEQYRKRFDTEPQSNSSRAYDCVMAIAESIKKCGASSAEIQRCLTTIEYTGASGTIAFDATRNLRVSKDPSELLKIKSGKIVPLVG